MSSITRARRTWAIVALGALVGVVAISVGALIGRLLLVVAALAGLSVAIGAASYAITRTGALRWLGFALALAALVTPLVLVVVDGNVVLFVLAVALLAVMVGATKRALGTDLATLKARPTPGTTVGPAGRPVLLMNPKSGGGKVERFGLVEECRKRGIEPVVLGPGDDLVQLARSAVEGGADVVGMAGGDGSQALAASVAMRHDVGYVCVPAGTRNHLAMDLGLDRDDVVGALDAFGEAVERRIDLGTIGDRVFVNNATMGLYAKIVQSPEYRGHKLGSAFDMLPAMLGPDAQPFDLQFTGPDGVEHRSAHLILVSNDPYRLGAGDGFGSRASIEAGTLGIVVASFRSSNDIARFVQLAAAGRVRRFPGWLEWSDTSFVVRSDEPIEVGIDGEALVLDSPLEFRTVPGALRVRIPYHAPGYSPAGAAPPPGWATISAVLRVAFDTAPAADS